MRTKICKFFFILCLMFYNVSGSTHWIVTEDGRIQSNVNSPFHMKRPYDLMALLDQEIRRDEKNKLHEELVSYRTLIDEKWSHLEGARDVESKVYAQDSNCVKTGTLLSDIKLFSNMINNGSDRGISIDLDEEIVSNEDLTPDCSKFSELKYSMFTYEHLQPMAQRDNLTIPSKQMTDIDDGTSEHIAKQIGNALFKNSSSWVHYNLGAMYWRMEGDAPKAVECARRALYYVPMEYRDIPLFTLAGIFFLAKHARDAALILHAAIDHAPNEPVHYLALGHVYTVLADYNRSIMCYDNILRLKPDYQDVIALRRATLCHQKLEMELMALDESLQDIIDKMQEYHNKQQRWLLLHEKYLWEQVSTDLFTNNVLPKKSQRCVHRVSYDSKSTITCDIPDNDILTPTMDFDVMQNYQKLLSNIKAEAWKINKQLMKNKGLDSLEKKYNKKKKWKNMRKDNFKHVVNDLPSLDHIKYPAKLHTTEDLYFEANNWPSREECIKLSLNEHEDLNLPVYLPPENRGYEISKILSDYIQVPSDVEHELPWYPPICKHADAEMDESYLPSSIRKVVDKPLKNYEILSKYLLKYVNNGKAEEAEVGQRIVTAMQKKSGPSWLLVTLASLYWRTRANARNALICLDLTFNKVPKEHTDIILVSMGSLFHQLGLIEEAMKFANMAFKVNHVEPSTNFLLALLHYMKNNPLLATHYMKNVLREDPGYYEGQAEELLKVWACRMKLGTDHEMKLSSMKKLMEETCPENSSSNGEGLCNFDGNKATTIQCVPTETVSQIEDHRQTVSNIQCPKHNIHMSSSLISALLRAKDSDMINVDKSRAVVSDRSQRTFHMRITLGDEAVGDNTLDDFYVTLLLNNGAIPDTILHVYDKSGKYPSSHKTCDEVKNSDSINFSLIWQLLATRNLDISPFLKPINKSIKEHMKPRCLKSIPSSTATLDHLTSMVLRNKLPNVPDPLISEWLNVMANDHQVSLNQLGTKISIALQEDSTSWILAMAASVYWQVIGNTEESITCLRQTLTYVPDVKKDIPLTNFANVLERVGFHDDALEVIYIALESKSDFVLNHFIAGNIHSSLGNFENAISFYRSALTLDPNFEPARNRLQAILCTFLFEENHIQDITDLTSN